MRKRILALPIAALAFGLISGTPAQAHDHGTTSTLPASGSTPASNKALFLTAKLTGANEVPGPKPVGDKDGSGEALVKVKGNRVTFALSWQGIGAPTLGHIHQGKAGVNGEVKVMFFGTPMPATANAAAGAVTVTDPAIADAIRKDPSGFYVNLHTEELTGGAIRGQLHRLTRSADILSVVKGGKLRAYLDGDQEVPGDKPVGDPDGHAVAFIRPKGDTIDYSLAWIGVTPTLGHIHQGRFGVNGDIKVHLFDTPVPDTIFAMSGRTTDLTAGSAQDIRQKPSNFYVNLHTKEFTGGAVRGQLFR
jgi:hypothetical protein